MIDWLKAVAVGGLAGLVAGSLAVGLVVILPGFVVVLGACFR